MKNNILVLEKFLLDKGVDTKKFRYLSKESLDRFLEVNLKYSFISRLFIWHNTREVDEFWKNLSNEWKNLCDNYKPNKIYYGFGIDYTLETNIYKTVDNRKVTL